MTTLAEITLSVARVAGEVTNGTATGGSTTTLIDTGRTEPTDYFTRGCIWFQSGNNNGKSAEITAYNGTTDTFTFATQAGACAAGNLYSAIAEFSRSVLWNSVNEALREVLLLEAPDVSLTTVANQASYSLPAGASKVRSVEIAQNLAAPYDFKPHFGWWTEGNTLYFDPLDEPSLGGYVIRLIFYKAHAELTSDTGTIDPLVNETWLKWAAARNALRWRLKRVGQDDVIVAQALNEAIQQANVLMRVHPEGIVAKTPRFPYLGN